MNDEHVTIKHVSPQPAQSGWKEWWEEGKGEPLEPGMRRGQCQGVDYPEPNLLSSPLIQVLHRFSGSAAQDKEIRRGRKG